MSDITFSMTVSQDDQRMLHTFLPFGEPTVVGVLSPWIPQHNCSVDDLSQYWVHMIGPAWPVTTDLDEQIAYLDARRAVKPYSIRLDVRMAGFARAYDCMAWTRLNFHTFMQSAALLCRVAPPNPRLRVLHLRLSAHADLYTMVENFISTSPHLTDIVIEDDSHPELDGLRRPILDLSSLVKAGAETSYFGLERFIIRAPAVQVNAVDCGSFLNRFQEATTICFAVYQIITRKPSWAWALDVLDVANYVERVEVSTSMSTEGDYRRQTPSTTPINLVNLRHLQLDLHEVDARLLFRLNAPKLRHLQIRSYREVSAHGELPHNHFPEMFSATVWCPGGAADRFRALGLRKRQYIHNISRTVLFEPQVDRELMIFIQKLAPDPPGGPSRSEPPHKRARVADTTSQDQLRQHSV